MKPQFGSALPQNIARLVTRESLRQAEHLFQYLLHETFATK
jgi:hypothetical protein